MNTAQSSVTPQGGLTAQQFLDRYGREETDRVCKAAGTNLAYYLQCCKGKRNFGRELAERLELASEGRMGKVALVFGESLPPNDATPQAESRAP